MSEPGEVLSDHNEKIVKLIKELKTQRDDITFLIAKQEEEQCRLQAEVERITYKITLVIEQIFLV